MFDFNEVDVSTGAVSVIPVKKRFKDCREIRIWLYKHGSNSEDFLRFTPDDNRLVRWGVLSSYGYPQGNKDIIRLGFSYLETFSVDFVGNTPEEMLESFFDNTSDENELKARICLDITSPVNTNEIWTHKNYASVYIDWVLDVINNIREGLSEYL